MENLVGYSEDFNTYWDEILGGFWAEQEYDTAGSEGGSRDIHWEAVAKTKQEMLAT